MRAIYSEVQIDVICSFEWTVFYEDFISILIIADVIAGDLEQNVLDNWL